MNRRTEMLTCCAALSMGVALAVGCGKPAPPPAGAEQNTTAPTVDLGPETGPKDAGAAPADTAPQPGSAEAPKGDQN